MSGTDTSQCYACGAREHLVPTADVDRITRAASRAGFMSWPLPPKVALCRDCVDGADVARRTA